MSKIYKTTIINIGNEAEVFSEENLIILFGEDVPKSLAEYCYNIKIKPIAEEIVKGTILRIGDEDYKITAVGAIVNKNLSELGHITIKFDGANEAELPGTLYVENKPLPKIVIGTEVCILGGF